MCVEKCLIYSIIHEASTPDLHSFHVLHFHSEVPESHFDVDDKNLLPDVLVFFEKLLDEGCASIGRGALSTLSTSFWTARLDLNLNFLPDQAL